jgi:hypothetical protein
MDIKEELQRRLQDCYPDKMIVLHNRVDPTSYKPFIMIAVNGKETPYGYFPDVIAENFATNPHDFINSYVQSVAPRLMQL